MLKSIFPARVLLTSCVFSILSACSLFAEGLHKSNFSTANDVLIATDLETDDLFAIVSLFHGWEKQTHRPGAIAFVVGEGNSYLKTVLMDHILQELKSIYPWTKGVNFEVIRGYSSKRPYATDIIKKKWPNLCPVLIEKSLEADTKALDSYFRKTVPQLIVALKPERELIFDDCCKVDFSNTQLWRYGSFNDRILWEDHRNSFQDQWTKHVRRFAAVVNLETFHALGNDENGRSRGSVSRASSPEIYAAYEAISKIKLHNLLQVIMENWNAGIHAQLQEEVRKLESEAPSPERDARLHRSKMVVAAVQDDMDFQFIGADTLVSTLLQADNLGEFLEQKHVSFSAQTGYTAYSDGADKIEVPRTDGQHQKNLWLLMQRNLVNSLR